MKVYKVKKNLREKKEKVKKKNFCLPKGFKKVKKKTKSCPDPPTL
jgi:hypothetical protein